MSCITKRRTRDQHAFSEVDNSLVPQFFTPDNPDISSNLKVFSSPRFLEPCKFKFPKTQESQDCHGRTELPEENHPLRPESFFREREQLLIFLQYLNKKLLWFENLSNPKIITQYLNLTAVKFQESSCITNMNLDLVNIDVDRRDLVRDGTCEICKSAARSLGKYNVERFNKTDFEVEQILCGDSVRKGSSSLKFMRSEKRMKEINETRIPQSFISSVCVAVITLIANFLAIMSINKKSEKLKRNIENAAPLARLSVLFTALFIFQILPLTCTADPLGNPYEILGVSRHATLQDIRKAYKHLVKEW